jgi:tRNA G10  N-methylase Trm11
MLEKGWLQKGDVILDPMCGIGSFLIVAAWLGYNAIGVELEERFIKDMEGYDTIVDDPDDMFTGSKEHVLGNLEHFRRVTVDMLQVGTIHVIQGDARQLQWLDIPANAVLCSPPYGNRLRDVGQQFGSKDERTWGEIEDELKGSYDMQYSMDKANIGNAKIKVLCSPPYKHGEHSQSKIDSIPDDVTGMYVHEYLEENNIASIDKSGKYNYEMLKVYKSLYQFLEPGAVVALVTRNFIQKKKVVRLDRLTISLMKQVGFTYLETKRANNPEVSFFRQINHKTLAKYGLPLIDWEEITFYRR